MQLRVLRRLGYLDEEWEKLLLGDSHGRVPKPGENTDEDARTVLHRLISKDSNEDPHDIHRLGG
jgi:hypothetical protein